jgi:hypothetical protein
MRHCQFKDWSTAQDFKGRLAEARAKEKKIEEAQAKTSYQK